MVELRLEGALGRFEYRTSYVLSQTWGNYSGLRGQNTFYAPWQAVNSTGLLPNDRTHILKLTTAVRPVPRLQVGGFFVWMSGTPINEFGASPLGPFIPTFLAARGSVGRTPSVWDLNLRVAYEVTGLRRAHSRIVMDLLHLGSPRRAVSVDESRYFALDQNGQQATRTPPTGAPRGTSRP